MKLDRVCMFAVFAAGLATLPGSSGVSHAAAAAAKVEKGGDSRNGDYAAPANWWKPAVNHKDGLTWGEVSGLVADTPDRIIVGVWGDRDAKTHEKKQDNTNYLVIVNRNGDIVETVKQWDNVLNKPHQLYISPYDPERHVWIVERGGGRGMHMEVLKFSNDLKKLEMRIGDHKDPKTRDEARANPHPGPYHYGDPACLAFFPNGDFLLADGYWNSRIVRYNAKGEFMYEFGSLGKGPGQFDLVHGVAIDQQHRIYVADRTNNRIQVFTEKGQFIEEWPNIADPVGVYIDERNAVWVISASLNRLLKYNMNGELQYYWGAYGGTRGGFAGGMSRPHQFSVDTEGNVYVASWDGGWANKYTPKPGANPDHLIGRELKLKN